MSETPKVAADIPDLLRRLEEPEAWLRDGGNGDIADLLREARGVIAEARAQIVGLRKANKAVDAVDPQAAETGTPSTRVSSSSSDPDDYVQRQTDRWGRILSEIRTVLGREGLTFDELPKAIASLQQEKCLKCGRVEAEHGDFGFRDHAFYGIAYLQEGRDFWKQEADKAEARLTEARAHRRACVCAEPDPVMQADDKFHCVQCSFETGARPACLGPERLLAEARAQIETLDRLRELESAAKVELYHRAESAEAQLRAAEADLAGQGREIHAQCHEVACNGDRRTPRGTKGVTCNCRSWDEALCATEANLRHLAQQREEEFDTARAASDAALARLDTLAIASEIVGKLFFASSLQPAQVAVVKQVVDEALRALRGEGRP